MTGRDPDDPILVRYLLGELPPEQEAELDERAFVDDAWDEERAAAADDLIDAYLTGGLTPERRQRFETAFLASPAHRERFRLLRDLRTVVERREERPAGQRRLPAVPPGLLWAIAAVLVAAIAAVLLLTRGRTTPPRIAAAATPTPTIAPRRSPTPEVTPGAATATVSLPARPGPVRLEVAAAVRVVRVRIPVPSGAAPRYVASVQAADRTLWEEGDLEPPPDGAPLVVDLPAEVLEGPEASLVLEPEATRSTSPRPEAARRWPLRLVRR